MSRSKALKLKTPAASSLWAVVSSALPSQGSGLGRTVTRKAYARRSYESRCGNSGRVDVALSSKLNAQGRDHCPCQSSWKLAGKLKIFIWYASSNYGSRSRISEDRRIIVSDLARSKPSLCGGIHCPKLAIYFEIRGKGVRLAEHWAASKRIECRNPPTVETDDEGRRFGGASHQLITCEGLCNTTITLNHNDGWSSVASAVAPRQRLGVG